MYFIYYSNIFISQQSSCVRGMYISVTYGQEQIEDLSNSIWNVSIFDKFLEVASFFQVYFADKLARCFLWRYQLDRSPFLTLDSINV